MPSASADPFRFGRFEINPGERQLRADGQPVAVGARAFDLLLALAQRSERLVGKQELLDLVWPGVVVEEHNITAQISSLRKLLGANVIATVPGRGYKFTATLDKHANDGPATAAPSAQPRHNLPEQRTRFIGRTTALADLARLLPQTRLLTLTGIGGCGKTRLALQCAQSSLDDFADGAWFVDLAPISEPERTASVCAAALGLATESEAALTDRLAAHLAGRQALIVLDNCEHVRAGAAALVDALLARPGRSRIIATSREPLAIAGEQLYPVHSLSLPATVEVDDVRAADAVCVFVDRARLALPEFEVDATNAGAVLQICRQLDGIALAIELAAARVTMLSVFDIAARLEDRFRLLTGGSSPVARQQTLLATMQWSYDLLTPAEQRLLRELAVFAGGCTLEAATAIARAADEYAALALLTALHDKSLLLVERGAGTDTTSGRPRYRMLETVRQYAQDRLRESGELENVQRRHAEFFLAMAEAAAPHLRGPQQSLWMARLHEENENLVAAITWCTQEPSTADPDYGLRLTAATSTYWLFNDVELGCRLALDALQSKRAAADSAARLHTLLGLAAMRMHGGRRDEGLPHAHEALAIARRLGAVEMQAIALGCIGNCVRPDGGEEQARSYHTQARDLAQAHGCARPLAAALNNLATIDFRHGVLEPAERGFRQALHIARGRGDTRSALIFLHNLVRVQVAARKHEGAHACAVEAEALLRGVGEDVLKLELLEVSAGLASSRGEHALAARFWGVATQRYVDAGYRRPPEDQAQLERLSAESRRAMGDSAFEQAEAAGRALAPETALVELGQWLQHRA
jgi:predicted ATPase/DNA-binding winged helix-turn-helix (wHTH) protein